MTLEQPKQLHPGLAEKAQQSSFCCSLCLACSFLFVAHTHTHKVLVETLHYLFNRRLLLFPRNNWWIARFFLNTAVRGERRIAIRWIKRWWYLKMVFEDGWEELAKETGKQSGKKSTIRIKCSCGSSSPSFSFFACFFFFFFGFCILFFRGRKRRARHFVFYFKPWKEMHTQNCEEENDVRLGNS